MPSKTNYLKWQRLQSCILAKKVFLNNDKKVPVLGTGPFYFAFNRANDNWDQFENQIQIAHVIHQRESER